MLGLAHGSPPWVSSLSEDCPHLPFRRAPRRCLGVARGDQSDQPEQGDRPDERRDQAHQDTTAGNTQKRGKDPPPRKAPMTPTTISPSTP